MQCDGLPKVVDGCMPDVRRQHYAVPRSLTRPCRTRLPLGKAPVTHYGVHTGSKLWEELFQRHRITVRIGRFHALLAPLRGSFQRSLTVLVCYRLPHFYI